MSEVVFEYRCRRCGKMERDIIADQKDGRQLLISSVSDDRSNLPSRLWLLSPRMTWIHSCGPDGMGVAELIGYSVRGDK